MVYNRLTDFELIAPAHAVLAEAWRRREVVLTPNPDVYRTFADKRLLVELSDAERVAEHAQRCGVDPNAVQDTLPRCEELVAANAERLWSDRRDYVFKPGRGHGSRGVYRGDKVSRSKWRSLVGQDYLPSASQRRPSARSSLPAASRRSRSTSVSGRTGSSRCSRPHDSIPARS